MQTADEFCQIKRQEISRRIKYIIFGAIPATFAMQWPLLLMLFLHTWYEKYPLLICSLSGLIGIWLASFIRPESNKFCRNISVMLAVGIILEVFYLYNTFPSNLEAWMWKKELFFTQLCFVSTIIMSCKYIYSYCKCRSVKNA